MSVPSDQKSPGKRPLEFDNVSTFDEFMTEVIMKAHMHTAPLSLPQINLNPPLFSTLDDAWGYRLITNLMFYLSGSNVPLKNLKINAQVDAVNQIEMTSANWKEAILKLGKILYPGETDERLSVYFKIPTASPRSAGKRSPSAKAVSPGSKQPSTPRTPATPSASASTPRTPATPSASASTPPAASATPDSKLQHRFTTAMAEGSKKLAVKTDPDDSSELDRATPTPPNTPRTPKLGSGSV